MTRVSYGIRQLSGRHACPSPFSSLISWVDKRRLRMAQDKTPERLHENKSRADYNRETRRTLTLYVEFMGHSKRQWQPWCAQSLHQESLAHSLHISSMHVTWCAGHKISIAVIKHLNNQVKSGKGLLWLLFSERLFHGPLNGQYLMEWHVAEEAYSLHIMQEKRKREDDF